MTYQCWKVYLFFQYWYIYQFSINFPMFYQQLTNGYPNLESQNFFLWDLYKTKFTDVNTDDAINNLLNKLEILKLSEEQKQTCEGRISVQEYDPLPPRNFQFPSMGGIDILWNHIFRKCKWVLWERWNVQQSKASSCHSERIGDLFHYSKWIRK